jgi:hypothetical protein
VLAQTTEHLRWALDLPREDERCRQVVELSFGGFDFAQGAHSIKRAAIGRRRENRDTTPAVCHLNRFALFDTA